MKKIIKFISKAFCYVTILLWIGFAIHFFYKIFIFCNRIGGNCYTLLTYWIIFPILSFLAYNSTSYLLKKYSVKRLVKSILIAIFFFWLPIIEMYVTSKVEPFFNVDNSLIGPIVASLIIIVSLTLWFILGKLLLAGKRIINKIL